jgi:lysophospholipase L1-like esterase
MLRFGRGPKPQRPRSKLKQRQRARGTPSASVMESPKHTTAAACGDADTSTPDSRRRAACLTDENGKSQGQHCDADRLVARSRGAMVTLPFETVNRYRTIAPAVSQGDRMTGIDRLSATPPFRAIACAFALALGAGGARAQTQSPPAADALTQRLSVEIDRFVQADHAAPPAPCQVLFIGSSSFVRWEDLVADMAPVPVINRGFGGSYIEHVSRWFDQIVAPYRPRAIVFYAGENDLDGGESVAQVVANFDAFMRRKSQVLGNTPVYFISVKPSKLRFSELSLQAQVNAAIRARAARRRDLHYINVVPDMLRKGKPKDIFGSDNLHMNREGYLIWRRIVRAKVLPNTEAEERTCRRGPTAARRSALRSAPRP